ncbi:MAG: MerR family transcriptional regulator [Clostridia bacterium]|nr:MerR family transcriptional regulator [Clostridia bacterium]
MQIGEFAILCKTKISVLRHYDRVGLLHPDYVDSFTGYRYYRGEQVEIFKMITVLKEAGFSLSEISAVLAAGGDERDLDGLFLKKKEELNALLSGLNKAKTIICGFSQEECGSVSGDGDTLVAQMDCNTPEEFDEKKHIFELWIARDGYQRISPVCFRAQKNGGYSLSASVLKLSDKLMTICEKYSDPFEDDPEVVGKWQVVGAFAVREDFFTEGCAKKYDEGKSIDILYFLPDGENYWCYRWTKGKLIIEKGGGECSVNSYTVEKVGTQRYMFVDLKAYEYRRGGSTTVLVLRQLDNIAYSKKQIERTDNIDMPFENDEKVIGEWRAVGFVWDKDEFAPDKPCSLPLIYSRIRFFDEGMVESTFSNGSVVSSRESQEWTRGFVIRKWTKSACAYEIRRLGESEYLFLEWKSGDYIYGGMKTNYYVFERKK